MSRSKVPRKRGPVKKKQVKRGKKRPSAREVRLKAAVSELKQHQKALRAALREEREHEKQRKRATKGVAKSIARGKRLRVKDANEGPSFAVDDVFPGMSRHMSGTGADAFVAVKPEDRKLTRSEASRLAWVRRRARKLVAQGVSHFGARDWGELNKAQADALQRLTEDVLGPYAWLFGSRRMSFVKSAIDTGDKRVRAYFKLAEMMGYTHRQARTALFSPRAQPATR